MNFPPTETEPLISALRDELQESGALVRLLEKQRRQLQALRVDTAHPLDGEIEHHRSELHRSRQRRQQALRNLVGSGTLDPVPEEGISLDVLLPHFPQTVAPMIQGLVDEINQLISRVNGFSGDE